MNAPKFHAIALAVSSFFRGLSFYRAAWNADAVLR